MMDLLKKFERIVTFALMVLMSLVILVSTVELGWMIIQQLFNPPILFLDISDLLELFGFFMLILIGIELLETIRAYIADRKIRVEVVLLAGIIAISRKVIILDINQTPSLTLIGIASIVAALTVGYFVIRKAHNEKSMKFGGRI
jgi:uncharacterized membrane protein (DUF373 family)